MEKWNLVIDVENCENCSNCVLATKDEHIGNAFPGYTEAQPLHGHEWIKIERKVRGATPMVDAAYVPMTCNQCDDAPCIAAAGDDSVYKRPDGIVIIDPRKAKGRKDLVDSCPYGAIWWNAELEVPQKWIFDAHLLDQGWSEPRATQACATGCMQAMKLADAAMQQLAQTEKLEVLKPELNTKPRVYYKNLHLFNKCFIGGSVTAEINGVIECAAKVAVSLVKEGKAIKTAETDVFGDFKFDGLLPGSGEYGVNISSRDGLVASCKVQLRDDSAYLGEIRLAR